MRLMKTFLLLCGLLLAADCQSGTYVVVSLNAPALSGTVTSVQLQLSLAGKPGSTTPTLTEAGGGPISFPTSAVLNIPSGEGSLTVNAVALGAGGVQLATGTASGTVSHGHTLELNLTLMSASTGALMADVTSKDFGGVVVGSTSSPATVTITNSGSDVSGSITTSLGGTDAAMFGIDTDGCSGVTLAAGASCAITMHHSPTAAGSHSASLSVAATPGGNVSVALTGTGIAPGTLSADTTSKDFGTVDITGGGSAPTTFTISNSSTQASGAITVALGGANANQFTLTDNCSGKMVGTPCTVAAAFVPTTFGTKSATITISASPGGGVVINLTGVGRDSVALSVAVTGSGNVTGGGINCGNGGATCSVMVTRTTSAPTVMLTEAPAGGNSFSGWGGACSGNATTCSLTMSVARSVTATYAVLRTLIVTNTSFKSSTGTVAGGGINCPGTCTVQVANGTVINLTATPNGTAGVMWSGDCSGVGTTCALTMSADRNAKATFRPPKNYMFVSDNNTFYNSASFNGMGVAGADAVCQSLAGAASFPGSYKAWLSSESVSAPSHLQAFNATVRGWLRPDGLVFADTMATLLASGPTNAGNVNLAGGNSSNGIYAKTGTNTDGSIAAGQTCNGWTNTTGGDLLGDPFAVNTSWTSKISVGAPGCNSSGYIYCFEIDYSNAVP